jgi:hypothetical protein
MRARERQAPDVASLIRATLARQSPQDGLNEVKPIVLDMVEER